MKIEKMMNALKGSRVSAQLLTGGPPRSRSPRGPRGSDVPSGVDIGARTLDAIRFVLPKFNGPGHEYDIKK